MTDTDRGDDGHSVVVELSLDIEARAETVWSMLSTSEGFSALMQGQVTFEARAGSPFRAEFPNFGTVISGDIVGCDGEARHMALTWGSELGPQAADFPAASSLVEFRVQATESGCRVDLRHSGFPSARFAHEHDAGWRFHLGRLALDANRADLARGLQRTLAGWFTAWNDPDEDTRIATLRASCAEDVEFQDEWAVARGVERLNLHIANCHRFMPGWKIEPTADLRICRGEALAGWRSEGPTGTTEGHNHVRAAHDGTILRVAGFSAGEARAGD